MSDKQPEALFYANKLEKVFGLDDYAIEMRRLHEENKQLKDAVLAEREACAQVCESLENDMVSGKRTKDGDQAALTAAILSERIRERGPHD